MSTIPCIFPDIREIPPETSSYSTASSANLARQYSPPQGRPACSAEFRAFFHMRWSRRRLKILPSSPHERGQERRKISLSVLASQSAAVFGEGGSARRSTTTR